MYSSILPGDATSMLMPYHSVHAPHHTQINKPSRASCNILVVLMLKLITMASQVWIIVNFYTRWTRLMLCRCALRKAFTTHQQVCYLMHCPRLLLPLPLWIMGNSMGHDCQHRPGNVVFRNDIATDVVEELMLLLKATKQPRKPLFPMHLDPLFHQLRHLVIHAAWQTRRDTFCTQLLTSKTRVQGGTGRFPSSLCLPCQR